MEGLMTALRHHLRRRAHPLIGSTADGDEAGEVLTWRTEPNSIVQHAGIIRFQSTPRGEYYCEHPLDLQLGSGGTAPCPGVAIRSRSEE
jgi:hypothetical protein